MVFASRAFGNVRERCLDGEIVDAIMRWALHADCADEKEQIGEVPNQSARVLWLCGVAGAGKSGSIAARLQDLQRLGSLYCCDYRNRASLNPGSLFSTIAQHLADRDPLRKQRKTVRTDSSLRTPSLWLQLTFQLSGIL